MDFASSRRLVPLLATQFHETWASFSPDGKWLAFASNESGTPEIYVQALRAGEQPSLTGPRYLVSRSGAACVRWRREGRELFFLDHEGRVQAVAATLGREPVFGPARALFTISTEARAAIHSVAGFDVSADGTKFVIPVVSSEEGPSIVVIQNWEAQLSPKATSERRLTGAASPNVTGAP